MTKPPFTELAFAKPAVNVETRPDGGMVLTSPYAVGDYEANLGIMFRRWVRNAPQRVFLAERGPGGEGWRRVTYGEAGRAADSLAQALLNRGMSPDRPLMILSGNSVNHGLLTLGAFLAGVPVSPVSPAYSLMSQDKAKVRHIFDLVKPAMIYVESGAPFADTLAKLDLDGVEVVVAADPPQGILATAFGDLLATVPTPDVETVFAGVGPNSVAKYLFTSGSTGSPKGVINTHRMLCSNQAMVARLWPFLEEQPPVLVDWLPWNHTFGGNHDFNMVLKHGGTLYVDPGKPAPGLIEHTVASLREISPTIYFNVPAGYNMLLPYLEKDAELRRNFFRDLRLIFYAAAALPQDLWERLENVSIQETGQRVAMLSAWGSTETAPSAACVHWPIEQAGVIGLPNPGVSLKLVPNGAKLEVRVKGPNVMSGYLKRPDLTEAAFDREGFYRIGDAARLADPDDPVKGLVFDGRVAEDFKLSSGTWVHVGGLRVAALAAASPVLQDALVTGHDREWLGLLAWPNVNACKELCPDRAGDDDIAALLRAPEVVAHIRDGLRRHNAANPGSSMRIARVMLMAEPPSIDASEITDKGYINQNAALARRRALVEALHAEPPGDDVIVVE